MRIALVGDADDALGFALSGVRTCTPDTASAARQALDDLTRSPVVGLVLISSSIARLVPDVVEAHTRTVSYPAMLVVPPPPAIRAPADTP